MPHGNQKNHVHGPDWIDVFRLQADLHASQGVSTSVTIEAVENAGQHSLLCIVTALSSGTNNMPGIGAGHVIEVEKHDLHLLSRRVHEALSVMYEVFDNLAP